jgi:hypothetical protein
LTARVSQGDTAPNFTTALYLNGSPFDLSGASVLMRVAGTVGAQGYKSWELPGTWSVASAGTVIFPLNPSSLAPSNFPAASPANLVWEIRAVASGGAIYHGPRTEAPRFVVRARV